MSILVVEDCAITLMTMDTIIRKLGYSVYQATNGVEACEVFCCNRVDLVLMDLQMPLLDGIGAAKRMRQIEEGTGGRTPIVALTANVNMHEECYEAGMDGFLSKPVSIPELHKVLNNCPCSKNGDIKSFYTQREKPADENKKSFQRHYLHALKGLANDPVLFEELMAILFDNWDSMIDRIRQAFDQCDTVNVAKALHSLKGSVGVFGSETFSNDMSAYIQNARSGALPEKSLCMERIAREYEYISRLKKHFHSQHCI